MEKEQNTNAAGPLQRGVGIRQQAERAREHLCRDQDLHPGPLQESQFPVLHHEPPLESQFPVLRPGQILPADQFRIGGRAQQERQQDALRQHPATEPAR